MNYKVLKKKLQEHCDFVTIDMNAKSQIAKTYKLAYKHICEFLDVLDEQEPTFAWVEDPFYPTFYCSACGKEFGQKTKYCANCGAKMKHV